MCGICGVAFSAPGEDTPARVSRMVRQIAHRGPDAQGTFASPQVALGHARLSIIDLSETGRQPMASADGRFTIVYNGEVYNFRELRQVLAAAGRTFHGTSDTEVVLAAFAEWGNESFIRLNGMFAIAIWDAWEHRLTVARDRFGIKPLYYRLSGREFSFASELAALSACRGDVDFGAVNEFFWFGNPLGERTFHTSIRRLPPGSFARVSEQGMTVERYWNALPPVIAAVPDEDPVARTRVLLQAAVERQLVSDVPVGVFLSGGIDSSAITAFASSAYGRPLRTFSVGFDHTGNLNELPQARRASAHFRTEHEELLITGDQVSAAVRHLAEAHDDPFADAANIPLYFLARHVRNDVKVVLQGDGGDEMFAGYRRYKLVGLSQPVLALARAAHAVERWRGQPLWPKRMGRLAGALGQRDDALRMALLLTTDQVGAPPTRILAPAIRERVEASDAFARYRELSAEFSSLDRVQRMLYTDIACLLPDTFLEKVDKSTMAHGVETRVPFLDNELAEFAMALPSSAKVSRGAKKRILRAALRGVVPDWVLDAPKRGFNVPYGAWLRGPLAGMVADVVLSPQGSARQWFDRDTVGRLFAEHQSGAADHGLLLWKALQLGLWAERQQA